MTDEDLELDVEIVIEKPSRTERFHRSEAARAHRQKVKQIRSVKSFKLEKEEHEIRLRHAELIKQKKLKKSENSG